MSEICLNCVKDVYLREIARDESLRITCSYCGGSGPGLELVQLAAIVEDPLQANAAHGEVVSEWDSEFDRPVDRQMGDELEWFLQEECGIDADPATDLAVILEDRDPEDPRKGGEPFFDREQTFCRGDVYPVDHEYSWQEFSYRIRHERRFFDDWARRQLAEILGEPGSEEAKELPILEVGPEHEIEWVWRARRAESEEAALQITRYPARNLGPPPPEKAVPGRMNPAGIPVFYGALSRETALAEVRPWVGGLVVVGQFGSTRPLRLLDLTKLGDRAAGSLFQSGYGARAERLQFLRGFHQLIARPVQPHDELLDYIPTQAVAEYVANVLRLDGMVYASAQTGALSSDPTTERFGVEDPEDDAMENHNVALTGEAALAATETKEADSEEATPDFGASWEFKPKAAPGVLVFRESSADLVQVTSVRYEHKHTYVHDPKEKRDF